MTDIFLGSHYGTKNDIMFFRNIVSNLEHFADCTFSDEATEIDEVELGILPKVRTTFKIKYARDTTFKNTYTDLTMRVVGYNAAIPLFVKYISGQNKIYVPTIPWGQSTLAEIETTTKVYAKPNYESPSQLSIDSCSGKFTYGQTVADWGTAATLSGSWSVPSQLSMTNGDVYEFAGYNMSIATLDAPTNLETLDGSTVVYRKGIAFNDNDNDANDWASSTIRKWLNGKGMTDSIWSQDSTDPRAHIGCDGLMSKVKSSFFSAVVPVVNKVWVREGLRSGKNLDANDCEHVVDHFWLLGAGQVNCPEYTMEDTGVVHDAPDYKYDTAILSTAYETAEDKLSRTMEKDGRITSGKRPMSLRSASEYPQSTTGGGSYYGRLYVSSSAQSLGQVSPGSLVAKGAACFGCTIG